MKATHDFTVPVQTNLRNPDGSYKTRQENGRTVYEHEKVNVTVRVTVDLQTLAEEYAAKAYRTKAKKSRVMYGTGTVTVIKAEPWKETTVRVKDSHSVELYRIPGFWVLLYQTKEGHYFVKVHLDEDGKGQDEGRLVFESARGSQDSVQVWAEDWVKANWTHWIQRPGQE